MFVYSDTRFFKSLAVLLAVFVLAAHRLIAADDLADIKTEITKLHDEAVKRLQDWIGQVSIAAENRGYPEGAEYMAKLARDAGFQQATVINTDGKPGVFATLDAGAPKTVGLYFMYDVKQFDPAEWTSPPTEARIVDKPPLGKVMIGRGAVNQKGPEAAFLAALHAIRGAGKKMPVNLVVVAEGEEEIGSPHIPQLVRRPEVLAALNLTGGYDPTSTSAESALIKAQVATYKKFEIDPLLWPRNAGSYPGYVFTGEPLKLAAGHFGLGHGSGAHAPDEYYIIESTNPKIQGFDGAVTSFVEYLYELAK
jgi:acetylornithine deacetylase/succinyl-diaminopimelate desuccinylase-like protein